MPKTITLWSHGSNMQIEYANRITSIRHTGPFARIEGQPGQNTWGHFPFNNPTKIDNMDICLSKVYASFRTRSFGLINEILIYDGESIILEDTNLSLSGDHLDYEISALEPISISKGLNLVIGFQFKSPPPNVRETQIEIVCVGIELITANQ